MSEDETKDPTRGDRTERLRRLQENLRARINEVDSYRNSLIFDLQRDNVNIVERDHDRQAIRDRLDRLAAHSQRGIGLIDSEDLGAIEAYLAEDYKNF